MEVNMEHRKVFFAFAGDNKIAQGDLAQVAIDVSQHLVHNQSDLITVFDLETGKTIDLDLSGTIKDIERRYCAKPAIKSVGRPRLGVTAKEVTLLPRHWVWLGRQPSGASATLRKLVEFEMKKNIYIQQARRSRDATYTFMSTIGGNYPGYEEALRYLYGGDKGKFDDLIEKWPVEVVAQIKEMSHDAFTKK